MNLPNSLPWKQRAGLVHECVEADIREELESHIAHAADQGVAQGLSPEEAHALALSRFGDFEQTLRGCTRQRIGGSLMLQRLPWIAIPLLLLALLYAGWRSHVQQVRLEVSMAEMHNARDLFLAQQQEQSPSGLETHEVIAHVGNHIEIIDNLNSELNQTVKVAQDGTVLLPMFGHVSVVGLSRPEVEVLLREQYQPYYEQLNLYVRVLDSEPVGESE